MASIGLALAGMIMLFLPLMVVPGVVALVSAVGYWITIMVVRRRRA